MFGKGKGRYSRQKEQGGGIYSGNEGACAWRKQLFVLKDLEKRLEAGGEMGAESTSGV